MPQLALIANISGRRLDLRRAMTSASNSDWLALQAQTGRGPFMLAKRSKMLEKMGEAAKLLEDDTVDSAGFDEGKFLETITDLIFLARRGQGEKTVTWKEVLEGTSFFEALAAFNEAGAAVQDEAADDEDDPTAPRVSDPVGADPGPATESTKSSRTSS